MLRERMEEMLKVGKRQEVYIEKEIQLKNSRKDR